jgi:hypothetical protein
MTNNTTTREVKTGRTWKAEQRLAILMGSNFRCHGCGIGGPSLTRFLQCDHSDPNGPTTVANGQAMCGPCNRAKDDLQTCLDLMVFPAIDWADAEARMTMELEADKLAVQFAARMVEERADEIAGLAKRVVASRRPATVLTAIAKAHNQRKRGKVEKLMREWRAGK